MAEANLLAHSAGRPLFMVTEAEWTTSPITCAILSLVESKFEVRCDL